MARFNTLTARKSRSGWQDYVDYLQHSIEHSIIRAPRAGLVVYAHRATENKFIAVGERVHYQQKLFTIADRSTMTIAGRVSDRDFFSLRRGQPANVRLPSLPGRIFPATLGWLGAVKGHRTLPLGVEHFGQTGTIGDLYAHFGINAESITKAAIGLSDGKRAIPAMMSR